MSKQNNQWVALLKQNHVTVWLGVERDIEWLSQYETGQEWLTHLIKETRTITTYVPLFRDFCEFVHMNPDELFRYHLEGLRLALNDPLQNKEKRRINRLLETEAPKMKMKSEKRKEEFVSKSTLGRIQVAVRSFFKWNGEMLGSFKFPLAPLPNPDIPTVKDIEEMESKACLRDKALLWFFASTGIRPETVESLCWKDLHKTGNNEVPTVIVIEPQRMKGKGASKRYEFCFQVAFLHKKAWMFLEKYGKTINKNDNDVIFWAIGHNAIGEPLTRWAMWKLFYALSLKTFGKQKRFTPRNFRHFVATAYSSAQVTDLNASALIGHVIESTNRSYIRIEDQRVKDLLKEYEKALPFLV
jgi:site-specific recombinase XerD